MAILLVAFGFFGYEKLTDLGKLVDLAKPDINRQLQGAKDAANQVRAQTDTLTRDVRTIRDQEASEAIKLKRENTDLEATYERLRSQAGQYATLTAKLNDLTKQTRALETTVTLLPAIELHVFDGRREPISQQVDLLVRLINGDSSQVSASIHKGPSITFAHLPFADNLRDNYSVVVSSNAYRNVGYFPVQVSKKVLSRVDLMLIRKDAKFNFHDADWDLMKRTNPRLAQILAYGASDDAARQRYETLIASKPQAAASMFNITTAMAQVYLPQATAIDYIKEFMWDDSLSNDRLFGYANKILINELQLAVTHGQFAIAQEVGAATRSFRQVQLGEANLQLSFYEADIRTISGVECVKFEADMDYHKDVAAHVLLEVQTTATGLVDPMSVYVLRWTAGRRAGTPEFNPPYSIE